MFEVKITKKRLGKHWHYYRFHYLIALACALIAANLLLTGTTPKTPNDRKVDVIILCKSYNTDYLEALEKELLCALPPDQKEVNLMVMTLMEGQESTTYQVLAARLTAQEADAWILPADLYRSYAESGTFLALEDRFTSLGLPADFNASAARVIVKPEEDKPGAQHTCGIPLDGFTGLLPGFVPDGMVLAFPSYYERNPENTRLVVERLLSMTDLNVQSLKAGEGSFGFYIATQYIDSQAASAWKQAIQDKVKFNPEIPGVQCLPYHVGRASDAAAVLASRMPNYKSGMVMVNKEVFAILAKQGKLAPLDDAVAQMSLPDGLDLSSGRASAVDEKGNAGEAKLYGIPLDSFSGLTKAFNPSGMVLAFPAQGGDQLAQAIVAAKAVLGID